MKHGLKQEIKRGLSVLMAASMVASSALPVMAEEVVEEAVEVEVVSEEVADAEEDVVVDVAEDAEVVEEVIDGETLEVITEEAADGLVCQHPADKRVKKVYFDTDSTGKVTTIRIKETCGDPACDADPEWSQTTSLTYNWSDGFVGTVKPINDAYFKTTTDGTSKYGWTLRTESGNPSGSASCDKPTVSTIVVYEATYNADLSFAEAKEIASTTETVTAVNHTLDYSQATVKKPGTCTDHGTVLAYCTACKQNIEVEYSDYNSTISATSVLGKQLVAQGHKYVADINNVTWSDNYKKAWLKMTCTTCKHEVNVNVTQYIKMYRDASCQNEITSAAITSGTTCDADVTVYYRIVAASLETALEALADAKDDIDSTKQVGCDVNVTKLDGKTGIVYRTDKLVPSAAAINTGVVFSWDGTTLDANKMPVITATIKCATCTSDANKAAGNYTTHTFASNVDYTKGASKKSYPVSVEVIKGATTKNTSLCGAGQKETTEYTAVLKLNNVTYNCDSYKCLKNGSEVTSHKWTIETVIPGSNHSFSGNLTNENAIQNDSRYPLTKATCTTEGKGYFKCTKCGEIYFSYIPTIAHKYIDKTVATKATCAADTTYTAYCDICNKPYTYETAYASSMKYAYRAQQWRAAANASLPGWPTSYGNDKYKSACEDIAACYDALDKAAKAELVAEKTAGHNYKVDEKTAPSKWAADFSEVVVTFTCAGTDHSNESALHVVGATHTDTTKLVTVPVTAANFVTEVPAGFDTKGKGHYEVVATFTDCLGKEWSYTAVSKTVEIPATGIKNEAVVKLAEETKTVTYTGNSFDIKATTNSTAIPEVKYYKDAACTQQYKGTPYTAGTYYVKATVKEAEKFTAAESSVSKLVIKKVTPTVKVKASKTSVTYNKNKAQTINLKTTVKVPSAGTPAGKITYSTTSDQIKVNSNGVVTVKKGAKKGTYTVKVKVAKTANYKAVTTKIKITVK